MVFKIKCPEDFKNKKPTGRVCIKKKNALCIRFASKPAFVLYQAVSKIAYVFHLLILHIIKKDSTFSGRALIFFFVFIF